MIELHYTHHFSSMFYTSFSPQFVYFSDSDKDYKGRSIGLMITPGIKLTDILAIYAPISLAKYDGGSWGEGSYLYAGVGIDLNLAAIRIFAESQFPFNGKEFVNIYDIGNTSFVNITSLGLSITF